MSYTALDYDTELKSTAESFDKKKSHKLTDGGIIAFAAQRFRCPEVLFQLSFIGKETSGVHDTSFQSIIKCDVDIRRDLYANVVLSGGTPHVPRDVRHHDVATLRRRFEPHCTQL